MNMVQMKAGRGSVIGWTLCLLLVGLLAGCGGAPVEESTTPADSSPPVTAAEQEPLETPEEAAELPDAGAAVEEEVPDAGQPADAADEADEEVNLLQGTRDEAMGLLRRFVQDGADCEALSRQLCPSSKDYLAVFEPGFAKLAEESYSPAWEAGVMVVAPKAGQTEVLLFQATTEDIKKWTDEVWADFPGGYEKVADKFLDGLTIYRFKFVEPGEDLGMAYDGLVFVNGHWRLFPKPWRVLETQQ